MACARCVRSLRALPATALADAPRAAAGQPVLTARTAPGTCGPHHRRHAGTWRSSSGQACWYRVPAHVAARQLPPSPAPAAAASGRSAWPTDTRVCAAGRQPSVRATAAAFQVRPVPDVPREQPPGLASTRMRRAITARTVTSTRPGGYRPAGLVACNASEHCRHARLAGRRDQLGSFGHGATVTAGTALACG